MEIDQTKLSKILNDPKTREAAQQSGILIGRDGQLFLTGGGHHVAQYLTGERRASKSSVETFHANLSARNTTCEALGLPYAHVVFPDVMMTLAEWHDLDVESLYQRDYLIDPEAEAALRISYPLGVLQGRPDFHDKAESHYGAEGVVAVTRHFVGLFPDLLPDLPEVPIVSLSGPENNLVTTIDPTITEYRRDVSSAASGARLASNGVMAGENGKLWMALSPTALTEKTLLIFGDSFFLQMVSALSHVFRRIVFCRTPFFHTEMIESVAPDVLVTGNAERYLSDCKADNTRQHFLAVALARGLATTPSAGFSELWEEMISREGLLGAEGSPATIANR